MKRLFLICVFFLLYNAILYSQTGWFQQNSGTSLSLQSVFFINDLTGFTAGGFTIFKTTNGGTTWIPKILPDTTSIYSVRFLNLSTGYACGGRYMNPYESRQHIFKTTNAGENWTLIYTGYGLMTSVNYYSVYPAESFVYVAAGGTDAMNTVGGIILSTNNGTNFINSSPEYGLSMEKLSFLNSQTGWACGTAGTDVPAFQRKIFKTTNGGTNWMLSYRDSAFNQGFPSGRMQMSFANSSNGFTAYYRNNVTKFGRTSNGGSTWDTLTIPFNKNNSLFFIDANTGWIGGNYYSDSIIIIRTTNAGNNWHWQKKTGQSTIINAIYFINNLTGWAVGMNGFIYKTITGGVTGISPVSGEVPSGYSLGQNYPNPFNSSSKFKVQNSKLEHIKITVYDINGKEVQTLVNEELQPGNYEVTFDGSGLNSGVYFYQMTAGSYRETRKMVLVK
jgi:photosystem II stability/assembly factor-like uncharacterized protein